MNENEISIQPEQINIYVEAMTSKVYHVNVDEPITEAPYYRNLIGILGAATEDDTVVFHLSTPGGNFEAGLMIYNAILNCEAHTISIIEAETCSAGTFFPMATDAVIAMPHSCLMFHPASYGTYGDTKQVRKFVDFFDRRVYAFMHEAYKGFFSPEEIDGMIENSHEVWLTADEVIERLIKREELRQEEQELVLIENAGDASEIIDDVVQKKRTPRKPKKEVE